LLKSAKRARFTWGEKPKIVELSVAVPATTEVLSQAQTIEPQDKARWLEAKKLKSVRLGTLAKGVPIDPNMLASSRGAPSAATAATRTIKTSNITPFLASSSPSSSSLSSSPFVTKTVHRRKKRLALSLIKSIRLENNQAKAIKLFW